MTVLKLIILIFSFLCSQPEAQAAVRSHPQAHPPRAPPSRTSTSPLHLQSRTHPGGVSFCQWSFKEQSNTCDCTCFYCLCCCHRDETGALSGDEAARNHGGVSVAKRSESPNSFLDQESRRRDEEEPVYCTTPTYGISACVRERQRERQININLLYWTPPKKNNHEAESPPASVVFCCSSCICKDQLLQ